MRVLAVVVVLFGCSAAGTSTELEVQLLSPTKPCVYNFTPVPELIDFVTQAADRWSAATGCTINVTDEGGVPWLQVDYLSRGDGTEAPGGTKLDRSLVRMHVRAPYPYRTALHEMGHAMWGNHVDSDGALSGHKEYKPVIDESSLSEVCNVNNCTAFQIEN